MQLRVRQMDATTPNTCMRGDVDILPLLKEAMAHNYHELVCNVLQRADVEIEPNARISRAAMHKLLPALDAEYAAHNDKDAGWVLPFGLLSYREKEHADEQDARVEAWANVYIPRRPLPGYASTASSRSPSPRSCR